MNVDESDPVGDDEAGDGRRQGPMAPTGARLTQCRQTVDRSKRERLDVL